MPSQKIDIPNSRGELLSARLDIPDRPRAGAYALFAHCFTCTKNLRAIGNISQRLNEDGIAVLRFDFTGLGESEGDFAETGFSTNVEDLVAVADYMRAQYAAPQVLIGHSLGGAAVLLAAHHIPEAAAVVTIAAPYEPSCLKDLIGVDETDLADQGRVMVNIGGRPFPITRQFLADLEEARTEQAIRTLGRPLLALHSPLDAVVGIAHATKIFMAAQHPKSFVSLDKADHLLSEADDSVYAGRLIAAWASKYIAEAAGQAAAKTPNVKGARVVAATGSAYRADVTIGGRHRFVVDEPVKLGGTDMGGAPYDHLLVALGACTSITIRKYADRKGWPLEEAVTYLRHRWIDAAECEECETAEGMVDWIERQVELIGPLGAEQRARLLEIGMDCPLSRTLHGEVIVKTRLRD